MNTKLMMLMASTAFSVSALAQTQVATGTVVSAEDGEPIVGATVRVVGRYSHGTITDAEGRFSLKVAEGAQLEISYIGMGSKKVKAGKDLNVVLDGNSNDLDEVMVVAYGTTKKSSFTGSAANIDNKKLELRPITNASKALEGQATGVLTTSGTGQPGSDAGVRIRGFGSINASAAPLYVVDGIPYDGDLSSINPADIESMTVLKDASAGALYGARGANGVVMITTKRGKEGKVNVNWRSTIGWSNRAVKRYNMLNQKDFVQLSYEAARNEALAGGYDWAKAEEYGREALGEYLDENTDNLYNPFKNYTWANIIDPATGQVRPDAQSAWNEDWLDNVMRTNAFRHDHQLQISGGTKKTQYMISGGYLNEEGLLQNTDFERFNFRANVNTQVNDWFAAKANLGLAHSVQNYLYFDGSSTSNVFYSAQFVSPLFPMYMKDAEGKNLLDANGQPQLDYGDTKGRERSGSMTDYNPLGGLLDDKWERLRDVASVRAGLTFGGDSEKMGVLKGLKLDLNFGADYNYTTSTAYYNMHHGNQADAGGFIYKTPARTLSYTANELLSYNRSFGLNNIDVLFGHENYLYSYKYVRAGKSNLVEGITESYPGTKLEYADTYSNDYRIESWLGRVNWNYDNRYYLSFSLRSDGSSRFYKDNRWGTFWSIGGNWRLSEEKFMQGTKSWLTNLNVKASYGEQGNDDILDSDDNSMYYLWQQLNDAGYPNGYASGSFISTLENKLISWEKSGNFNIGFDAKLFDSRLSLNFEYYNKKTSDMLLSYPMAQSTGFTGYDANVGDMRNQGVEFEIKGTPVETKDLRWELSLMGSTVSNKVLKLTSESPEISNGSRVIKEGMELNTFYMSKSAGVDPETGKELYWVYDKDENGNVINERISDDYQKANTSKYYMGSRIPDLYGSIGTSLSYKGLELSILTTYSIGGKVFDGLYQHSMEQMYFNNNWNVDILRRWQKPGDITDIPRVEVAGDHVSYNDRFLIDASYFSIKNITLGYTLPQSWVKKVNLSNVRVFTSVDNLALFTHLDGMDPQYSFNGITDYSYTPNKTWSVGLEVKF